MRTSRVWLRNKMKVFSKLAVLIASDQRRTGIYLGNYTTWFRKKKLQEMLTRSESFAEISISLTAAEAKREGEDRKLREERRKQRREERKQEYVEGSIEQLN